MPLMAPRSSAMRNEIRRELERRRKAINIAKGRVVKKSSDTPSAPPRRLIPSIAGAAGATLKLGNAPREEAAKKCPAPPPQPRVLIPSGAPGADTKKIAYLDLGEAPKRCTAPRRRDAFNPFAMKAAKSAALTPLIPHASAAATKLLSTTTSGADTEHMKKPSSTPIQPRSSSITLNKGMTVKVRVPMGTLPPTGQRLFILHPAVVVSDVEDGYIEVIYKGNYPRVRTVRVALDEVMKWNLPGGHC